MSSRVWLLVLLGSLLGAAGFALGRATHPAYEKVDPSPEGVPTAAREAAEDRNPSALPPNHPPIGSAMTPHGPLPPAADQAPAITWKVPARWTVAPNPNQMRLATYRVPAAESDADGAEATVARAGGTAEANIQRWLGQFDEAGQDTRADKTVRGLKVTIVEVSGTYTGGAMIPGTAPASHPGWALIGAIVETKGSPYFFKLIGPRATVRATRPSFDALIDSITPS
jgi:hypothetical protein